MGPQNAAAWTGLMLISGDSPTVERAKPLLAPMTGKLVDLGERVDAAAAFKLMGNLFLMAFTAGCADMLALAKAMGVPPQEAATLFDHFNPATTVGARMKRMTDAAFATPSWELAMARKDARLMQAEADHAGIALALLPAIAARMDTPAFSVFGPSEPDSSVDVTADFHLPAWDKEALEPFIQEAATVHGMSPSLIRAVIQTESRFNPLAVSRVGAQGLMQLMPTTARHVGIENPFDPRENILGGTKYLSTLLDRFKGNTARALAAYNAGPTVVARHRGLPPYRETQGYVRKIQKLVQNTDAEFSLPVTKVVRKASLRSRAARKASISRNAARKNATVGKASKQRVVKASTRTARKPVRRAGRRG